MKIEEGGSTENISGKKIEDIKVVWTQSENNIFELWINDSLSYLQMDELLQLKREIQKELQKSIDS